MTFYRNYTNEEVVGQSDVEEKGQNLDKAVGYNEEVEATSSDNEVVTEYNSKLGNLPPSSRRMATEGKSGSSFWKDRQPMESYGASGSGDESKSGSEYKNLEEGSEDETSVGGEEDRNMSDDEDRGDNVGKSPSVPLNESSDEYYDQDDDHRELLHHRVVNQSSGFSSKLPASKKSASRKATTSKSVYHGNKNDGDGGYDDDDVDYEDEDEGDGMCILSSCILPCSNLRFMLNLVLTFT